MKALFLCAGKGTRLRPLTSSMSKHLLPVANKPILFYGLEQIADSGIRDVGIVVGENSTDIEAAVGNGSKFGLKVTYILQDNPKGLAHAVKVGRDFVGDDDFVVYLGDNLLMESVKPMVEKFNSNHEKPSAMVLLTRVDNPSQFGIAELDSAERILRVVEKPENPPTDLAIIGIYLFDKRIFKAIDGIKPSDRGELEITDAIQYLIDNQMTVQSHIVGDWWKDTGRPDDIIEANRFFLERIEADIQGSIDSNSHVVGQVQIHKKAKIINSTIRGPVVIGKNTVIENSFVGPFTSIGDDVRIIHSEIEHSVVCADSVIENIEGRIDESLIGKNVILRKVDKKPRVFRFILGDNSKSELI
jgi:glucose-1-phosphate thymidylyltransferase